MSITKQRDSLQLLEKIPSFPWFVEKYVDHKRSKRASVSTLIGYLRDFEFFFRWLMAEGLSTAQEMSEITLDELEGLRKETVEAYLLYLQDSHLFERSLLLTKPTKSAKKEYSDLTISRKLSSLKSLFYYLSALSEDEHGESYLKRNVMAKIELHVEEVTPLARANAIRSKILIDDQIQKFVDFVYHGYLDFCDTKKKLHFHYRNRDRDVAIIALILSGGFRVSEIVNLNLQNVVLEKNQVLMIRKGKKEDAPFFSDWGKEYLLRYLNTRQKYQPPAHEDALFLTVSPTNPIGHRIDLRSVQKLVKKYGSAFGMPDISVHKLRHSFATQFLRLNPDPHQLQAQLGHSKIDTTMQYAHVLDDALSQAVNRTTSKL
ncbi:tyrosine recombinase XerS [Brevibacillus laterosporus]|uniref:tyrosine recombinase XerS n=1 Tax=Brevibacillus laterosporus TaxID=1465 RepID=UPI002406CCBA|nr:tyrosine recombinase XerS [Brevibacillus laterosporus]MDF9410529.1 tyrosine recombinase XerS [Brevibacillus laterosporus]